MKERLNTSQLHSILSLLLHWYCIGILTMNYQINYMDQCITKSVLHVYAKTGVLSNLIHLFHNSAELVNVPIQYHRVSGKCSYTIPLSVWSMFPYNTTECLVNVPIQYH